MVWGESASESYMSPAEFRIKMNGSCGRISLYRALVDTLPMTNLEDNPELHILSTILTHTVRCIAFPRIETDRLENEKSLLCLLLYSAACAKFNIPSDILSRIHSLILLRFRHSHLISACDSRASFAMYDDTIEKQLNRISGCENLQSNLEIKFLSVGTCSWRIYILGLYVRKHCSDQLLWTDLCPVGWGSKFRTVKF